MKDENEKGRANPAFSRRFYSNASTSVVKVETLSLLDDLEIRCGFLAAVHNDLEFDLLSFDEAANSGALERRYVNEHVGTAFVRLNETETLLSVEKLYLARSHFRVSSAQAH
jgi:hypothetical protein